MIIDNIRFIVYKIVIIVWTYKSTSNKTLRKRVLNHNFQTEKYE